MTLLWPLRLRFGCHTFQKSIRRLLASGRTSRTCMGSSDDTPRHDPATSQARSIHLCLDCHASILFLFHARLPPSVTQWWRACGRVGSACCSGRACSGFPTASLPRSSGLPETLQEPLGPTVRDTAAGDAVRGLSPRLLHQSAILYIIFMLLKASPRVLNLYRFYFIRGHNSEAPLFSRHTIQIGNRTK